MSPELVFIYQNFGLPGFAVFAWLQVTGILKEVRAMIQTEQAAREALTRRVEVLEGLRGRRTMAGFAQAALLAFVALVLGALPLAGCAATNGVGKAGVVAGGKTLCTVGGLVDDCFHAVCGGVDEEPAAGTVVESHTMRTVVAPASARRFVVVDQFVDEMPAAAESQPIIVRRRVVTRANDNRAFIHSPAARRAIVVDEQAIASTDDDPNWIPDPRPCCPASGPCTPAK